MWENYTFFTNVYVKTIFYLTKLYYCNNYIRGSVDYYLAIIEKLSKPFSSYLREPTCKKNWISFFNVDYHVSYNQTSFFSYFNKNKSKKNDVDDEIPNAVIQSQENNEYINLCNRIYGSPEEIEIYKGNANHYGFYLCEKYFSFDPITEYHVLHYPIQMIFSNFRKKKVSTHLHNNLLFKYENYYLSKIVYLSNNESTETVSYKTKIGLKDNAYEKQHSTMVSHSISKFISLYDIFPFIKQNLLEKENISKKGFHFPVSNVRFIAVQYVHPKMKESIEMVIGDEYYVDGNELFSFSFILRFLYYQKEDFYFDYNYKIEFIDSSMKQFELKWNQYILIEKDSYSICFV